MIRLITKKEGNIEICGTAKPGVSLPEVEELAENEVYGGYADYARIEVDGELYMELEA